MRAPTVAGSLARAPLFCSGRLDPQKTFLPSIARPAAASAQPITARRGVVAAAPHRRRRPPQDLPPPPRRRREAAGLPDSSRAQARCLALPSDCCAPVAPAAPDRPPKSARMNENVKIDYDTAEKVMDLDGCGLRHPAAPATPDARAGPRSTSRPSATRRAPAASREAARPSINTPTARSASGAPQVDEDHDDPGLQLGEVRGPEAAQAPGRLVPGPSPASETLRRRRALYCNTTQAWCPATHFGYQTQGTCKIKFEDGTETTINARRGVLEAASTSA